MAARIRSGSAQGTKRAFTPTLGLTNADDQAADALDSIARSLSAIDHNLEVLTGVVSAILQEMQIKS